MFRKINTAKWFLLYVYQTSGALGLHLVTQYFHWPWLTPNLDFKDMPLRYKVDIVTIEH